MVIIRNVKKIGDIISFNYYPEGRNSEGYVEYNYVKDEVVYKRIVEEYDKILERYCGYAVLRIKRVIKSDDFKNNDFKDEYEAFWY